MEIVPFKNKFLAILYLLRICLDFPLYILLSALSIADWLLQWTQIASNSFGQHETSSKKF